jgi:formate dehydrogenase major subunit
MTPEGLARLFVPLAGLADGPFPEHYEPMESPVVNALHPKQSNSPVVKKFKTPLDKYATPKDGYNIVCTSYRLTEHYHYWTKNNPMNMQLVPEPFVEMSLELAEKLQIKGGDKVKVSSIRSTYYCKAMVTSRMKPMKLAGQDELVHQVGIPIHWGYMGLNDQRPEAERTPANLLSPTVIDPNAYTPEFKGFLVKIEKA